MSELTRDCIKCPRSEPFDAAQDISEQFSRDYDLGHLERDVAPVANDFAADLGYLAHGNSWIEY